MLILLGVQTAAALGPEMQQVSAHGEFVVARVRTWFDERTISAHRGNGPLTPNGRKLVLVDGDGRSFGPSPEGQAAIARFIGFSTPLTTPLRPGESYTTDFVFECPQGCSRAPALNHRDDPETRLVIGHENSLFHKKIYFGVDSAASLTKSAR